MSTRRVIRSIDDLRAWCSYLYTLTRPLRVAAIEGEDRSLDQNALAHKWFTEVGQQMGETVDEVKARAKLDIGTIILCRDDPEFLAFCKKALGHLGRKDRLEAMRYINVTSILTIGQMREFMDTFERMHRAEGLQLTHPDDR